MTGFSVGALRSTAFIASGLAFALAGARGVLFGPSTLGAVILFLAAVGLVLVGLAAGPFLGRRGAGIGIPAVALVSLCCLAWTDGSISSDAVYWLPFTPVVSALFVDRKAAWLSGGIATVLIVALVIRVHGLTLPAETLVRAPAIVGAIWFGTALVTVYDGERRLSAKQGVQREQNLREFLHALPIGTVLLDSEGMVVHTSNARSALPRDAANHLEETSMVGALPDRMGPALRSCASQCRRTGAPTVGSLTIGDGEASRSIELRAVPFSDEHVAIVLIDVTELRHVAQLKDQFVATVSHELRTPLSTTMGAIRLLAHGKVPEEEVPGLFEVAERNAVRLMQIVEDLLDMQQLSTRHLSVSLNTVAVAPVLTAVVEELGALARGASIRLALGDVPASLGVVADSRRMHQILVNLVGNALKFSPSDTVVSLQAEKRGAEVCIRVRDQGVGISPSECASVFEPFAQLDSTASRGAEGSGLGLAISKGLAERMGGALTVHSVLGEGSEFMLSLPISEPADS